MSSNWEKFGEEIRKTVQDAVENQNYDKLSQAISDTINQAVDAVADGVKQVTNYRDTKQKRKKPKQPPVVQVTRVPSKAGAIVAIALGYTLGGIQLLALLGNLAATSIADAAFGIDSGYLTNMFTALSISFLVVGFSIGSLGVGKLKKINRFKNYLAAIGDKEYCNISDLAERAGKTKKTVIRDIRYMIKNGWFLQGHLDKQKTCLIITDQMYAQYCQLEHQRIQEEKEDRERKAKKEKLKEEQIASRKNLSPEVQKIIEQGDEYVKKIRACNDAIPGEEISEKIYRIEMLVDKIFDRVEQNPKCIDDIRKLMDYYLPTTVKLLEAYAEMDAQPVGGENIQSAKREIETTLDTLNVAFEKLLDSLFLEQVWDVSSDISVLNTMLAQEGLKEDGLKRK